MLKVVYKDTDELKCTLCSSDLMVPGLVLATTMEILKSLPLPHPSLKGTERGVARSSS